VITLFRVVAGAIDRNAELQGGIVKVGTVGRVEEFLRGIHLAIEDGRMYFGTTVCTYSAREFSSCHGPCDAFLKRIAHLATAPHLQQIWIEELSQTASNESCLICLSEKQKENVSSTLELNCLGIFVPNETKSKSINFAITSRVLSQMKFATSWHKEQN
jgi:hypothetical protein